MDLKNIKKIFFLKKKKKKKTW